MAESKRYTIVSKQSIDTWIDTVGNCKVPDDVVEILSEDVTYRIRELVHNSLQVMKHCKRSCLTVDDLNSTLKESDTEPIFGHGGSDNLSFKAIAFKEGTKVCYLDEKDVNLREIALEAVAPSEPGETTVKASWLLLEGHPCVSGRVKDDLKSPLTEPSATYLQNITSALIGNGQQLRKVALDDLKSNKKLQIIIPHLVSFCSSQIKQHTEKETFSQIASYVIATIDSLVKNSSVILVPYIVQLAKIMLFILIEAKLPVLKWHIKDKTSSVLALLSRRTTNTSHNLKEQLLKSYTESLNDDTKALSYLYGAIVGIKELGTNAICQGLYPKAREKLKSIDILLSTSETQNDKYEIIAVLHAITDTLAIFYKPRFQTNASVIQRRKSQSFSALHKDLVDVAGEAFFTRCLSSNHDDMKNNNSQNNQNKNGGQVNGDVNSTDTTKEIVHMNVDTVPSTKKPVAKATIEKQCTESNLGNINTTSKWKMPKLKKTNSVFNNADDANHESELFQRDSDIVMVKNKRKAIHGSHNSLVKKKSKKFFESLSTISLHLPIF